MAAAHRSAKPLPEVNEPRLPSITSPGIAGRETHRRTCAPGSESRAILLDEHRPPTEILPIVSRIYAGSRVVECPIAVAAASSPKRGRGSASIAVSNAAGTKPPQKPPDAPV